MSTDAIHNTAFAGHAGSNVGKSHSTMAPETDDALLTRLYAGEESAFDELVNKHHGALIRMAMGYVADRDAAEEVVQDTWMAVIENLSRFEGRSSLRTWIFGILIHKAKDRGIREKRHTTFSAFQSIDASSDSRSRRSAAAGSTMTSLSGATRLSTDARRTCALLPVPGGCTERIAAKKIA